MLNLFWLNIKTFFHNLIFWFYYRFNKKNMIEGLFLDDERFPKDVSWISYGHQSINWKVVRTYKDFQHHSRTGVFKIMSFDHDLGEKVTIDMGDYTRMATGLDCLRYLTNLLIDRIIVEPDLVFYHTQNSVGRINMEKFWESYKRSTGR